LFVCSISVRSQPVFSGESSAKVILYFVSPKLFFVSLKPLFLPFKTPETCCERRSKLPKTVPLNRGANVDPFITFHPLSEFFFNKNSTSHNQLLIDTLHLPAATNRDKTSGYSIETSTDKRRIDTRKETKGEKYAVCQLDKNGLKIIKMVSDPIKPRFIYQMCYFYTSQ
jgi:hypothetical protein